MKRLRWPPQRTCIWTPGQRDPRRQHNRLPLHRHARLRRRPGLCRTQIRPPWPEARDGPRHPTGARGLHTRRRRGHRAPTIATSRAFPLHAASFSATAASTKPAKPSASPSLPRTLERIAADPEDFYHGSMAHELVDDLSKGGALLTLDDLAQYNVVEREPVIGHLSQLHGHQRAAALLRRHRAASARSTSSKAIRPRHPRRPHARLDPPDHRSLSPRLHGSRRLSRRSRLQPHPRRRSSPQKNTPPHGATASSRSRATPSAALDAPRGISAARAHDRRHSAPNHPTPRTTPSLTAKATPSPSPPRSTTASAPTSLPARSASCSTTRWTTSPPRWACPNMYGLIQGPANAIAPGKRPLSAMTPTIVLEDGKLRYVLGSPGGAPHHHHRRQHLSLRGRGRPQHPAGRRRAPLPSPVPARQALPRAGIQPRDHRRAARHGLHARRSETATGRTENASPSIPKPANLLGGQDHRSHYGKAAGY